MKKIFFIFLCFIITTVYLHAKDDVEKKIKQIRKEYKELNKGKYKVIYFYKKENEKKWYKGFKDEPEYVMGSIYLDKKGRIRKYIEKTECPYYTQREEFFLNNGEIFFIFHKDVSCGAGQGGEIRYYFDKKKIIRKLKKQTGFHPSLEWAPPEFEYHLHTKEIKKKFKLK